MELCSALCTGFLMPNRFVHAGAHISRIVAAEPCPIGMGGATNFLPQQTEARPCHVEAGKWRLAATYVMLSPGVFFCVVCGNPGLGLCNGRCITSLAVHWQTPLVGPAAFHNRLSVCLIRGCGRGWCIRKSRGANLQTPSAIAGTYPTEIGLLLARRE